MLVQRHWSVCRVGDIANIILVPVEHEGERMLGGVTALASVQGGGYWCLMSTSGGEDAG